MSFDSDKVRFRYLLLFYVPRWLWGEMAAIARRAGLDPGAMVAPHRLHVTVCAIWESMIGMPGLAAQVHAAIDRLSLCAPAVQLGRVKGADITLLGELGPQREVRGFFGDLMKPLEEAGLPPLYRKGGLHAHTTLSYRQPPRYPFEAPVKWRPKALHLVKSERYGEHEKLASWQLLPPVQGEFDWGAR